MPTRRDTNHHCTHPIALPTILIALLSLLAAGCDKIQIPEVGQQAAPVAPPAPTTAGGPVAGQAAPVAQAPTPVPAAPAAKPDSKAVVDAFLAKAKSSPLTDIDLMQITDIEGLEHLEDVQELNLLGAGVTNTGVARLTKFPKLAKLDLSTGGVTNEGLKVIKDLPELRSLSLNHVLAVDDLTMSTIAANPGIKELYLDSTHITDVGLNELEKLENLEVLNISSTSITGAGFERFKGHKHLRSVIAQRSQLKDDALKYLLGSPIEVLEIDMSGVTDMGMVHIGKMKNLKRLSMGFSNISDFGIRKLGVMKNLEYVNARNCGGISNLLFEKLKTCKNLKYVCVTGTGVTPAACVIMKKLIPGCEIAY